MEGSKLTAALREIGRLKAQVEELERQRRQEAASRTVDQPATLPGGRGQSLNELAFEVLYWRRKHAADTERMGEELSKLRHERTEALQSSAEAQETLSSLQRFVGSVSSSSLDRLSLAMALTQPAYSQSASSPVDQQRRQLIADTYRELQGLRCSGMGNAESNSESIDNGNAALVGRAAAAGAAASGSSVAAAGTADPLLLSSSMKGPRRVLVAPTGAAAPQARRRATSVNSGLRKRPAGQSSTADPGKVPSSSTAPVQPTFSSTSVNTTVSPLLLAELCGQLSAENDRLRGELEAVTVRCRRAEDQAAALATSGSNDRALLAAATQAAKDASRGAEARVTTMAAELMATQERLRLASLEGQELRRELIALKQQQNQLPPTASSFGLRSGGGLGLNLGGLNALGSLPFPLPSGRSAGSGNSASHYSGARNALTSPLRGIARGQTDSAPSVEEKSEAEVSHGSQRLSQQPQSSAALPARTPASFSLHRAPVHLRSPATTAASSTASEDGDGNGNGTPDSRRWVKAKSRVAERAVSAGPTIKAAGAKQASATKTTTAPAMAHETVAKPPVVLLAARAQEARVELRRAISASRAVAAAREKAKEKEREREKQERAEARAVLHRRKEAQPPARSRAISAQHHGHSHNQSIEVAAPQQAMTLLRKQAPAAPPKPPMAAALQVSSLSSAAAAPRDNTSGDSGRGSTDSSSSSSGGISDDAAFLSRMHSLLLLNATSATAATAATKDTSAHNTSTATATATATATQNYQPPTLSAPVAAAAQVDAAQAAAVAAATAQAVAAQAAAVAASEEEAEVDRLIAASLPLLRTFRSAATATATASTNASAHSSPAGSRRRRRLDENSSVNNESIGAAPAAPLPPKPSYHPALAAAISSRDGNASGDSLSSSSSSSGGSTSDSSGSSGSSGGPLVLRNTLQSVDAALDALSRTLESTMSMSMSATKSKGKATSPGVGVAPGRAASASVQAPPSPAPVPAQLPVPLPVPVPAAASLPAQAQVQQSPQIPSQSRSTSVGSRMRAAAGIRRLADDD